MLSKKELQQRVEDKSGVTKVEANKLIEGFGTPIMDICYACEVSKTTMDIYLGQNTQPLPKKHRRTIAKYYLDKYNNGTPPASEQADQDPDVVEYNGQEEDKGVPKIDVDIPKVVDKDEEDTKPGSDSQKVAEKIVDSRDQKDEQDDIDPETRRKLEKKFNHLEFEKIVFRPKNGNMGQALLEALKYSRKAGIPVHVRKGDKLIKICEQS